MKGIEKRSKKTLSKQAEMFCIYYAASGKGADAAKKAGYQQKSKAGFAVTASRLLKDPRIIEKIRELAEPEKEKVQAGLIAGKEMLQQFWTETMFNEEERTVSVTESGEEITAPAVSMQNKLKASELLGKSQAIFITKIEDNRPTHEDWLAKFKEDNSTEEA